MKELLATLDAWRSETAGLGVDDDGTGLGVGVGRAVVVRTFGSAPRPEGAVLLRADDGRIAGSVSGGCVEGAAAEEIERARRDGHARVIRYGISDEDAWDVGLACGGTIDVLIEPTVDPMVEIAALERGAAIATLLPLDAPPPEFGSSPPGDGAPPEPKLVVTPDGIEGGASLGSAAAVQALVAAANEALLRGTSRTVEIEGRSVFVEAFPRWRLPVRSSASPASSATRPSSPMAERRLRHRSASRLTRSTASSSAGRTRWPRRSTSGRMMRSRS
jgi:xanthine dehydrogenase accessory factor